MFTEFPEEMQKLMKIVEPYFEKCHIREDAPQEIKDTYEKICKMMLKLDQ